MNSISHIKDMIRDNLKDILQSSKLIDASNSSIHIVNSYQPQTRSIQNDELGSVSTENLSKSIKEFVENYLLNDNEDCCESVMVNTDLETLKTDVNNISKALDREPKVSEIQERLFNILDICFNEINDRPVKSSNESKIDCSPLLQPKHITQVEECMSVINPLDVRISTLHCLLKSHFTDVVNWEGWSSFKRILVDNLCDSNHDVFLSCLKIHAKLASCSSSVAMKECALNLMESLAQHYFVYNNEDRTITLQNTHFYRMVHLTQLLLDIFREASLNIARFGDNKLDEMIDSFIQLMNIQNPTKQNKKNKYSLTPFEIVSYLDPNGKWFSSFTYFFLSRQFLISSISKNISFMRIIVEEIMNWINDPVIPSRETSNILHGELNIEEHRFCMFCHSLSIFSTICSFNAGREMFPIKVIKKDELLTVKDIVKMIIKLLDEFNELLHSKATKTFKSLVAHNLAKILNIKGFYDCSSLLLVNNENVHPIAIQVYDILSLSKNISNLFIPTNIPLKRKFTLIFPSLAINNTLYTSSGNTYKRGFEVTGTNCGLPENENRELIQLDNFLMQILDKLKNCNPSDKHCLVKILTNILKDSDRESSIISYATQQYFIFVVSETYMKFHTNFNFYEYKVYKDDLLMVDCCAQFLLNSAASTLGFHLLKQINMIAPLLIEGLHNPFINWSDHIWLLFVSKATSVNEGCAVLFEERDVIIRKELTQLWNIIDEDCSGSELPIEESLKYMLRIICNLTFNLKGVKAHIIDTKYGSELTLIDESDNRPSNICSLIQCFALNSDSTQDFIHHQFALNVLHFMVSNIDSSLYLENKLKYQDSLMEIQAANRIDDNSEVIIDECSLLRHKIIEKSRFPNPLRIDGMSNHIVSKPESTMNQGKSRLRGSGELTRWLSETRLGLHDYSWLKNARKLYKNSCCDEIKGSTISDLLEQIIKVFPETKVIKWASPSSELVLLPEEQLAVELVMRYGAYYRLIQSSQQNMDNLSHLILMVKNSLKKCSNTFEGFDWFVASAYLLCSGNVEKTQCFLSSIFRLPNSQLLWINLADEASLARIGHLLENVIAEELPIAFQALQHAGLSWWQMCHTWISQCWWNIFDWPEICHWFTISILHQPDYPLYFCAALLHANQDRVVMLTQEECSYEIIMQPITNFQFFEARMYMEKLNKKYHNILLPYFASN